MQSCYTRADKGVHLADDHDQIIQLAAVQAEQGRVAATNASLSVERDTRIEAKVDAGFLRVNGTLEGHGGRISVMEAWVVSTREQASEWAKEHRVLMDEHRARAVTKTDRQWLWPVLISIAVSVPAWGGLAYLIFG